MKSFSLLGRLDEGASHVFRGMSMNVQGEDKAGCSLGIHVCTESIVTKVGCQAIDVGLLLASSCRLVSGRVFCLMVGIYLSAPWRWGPSGFEICLVVRVYSPLGVGA